MDNDTSELARELDWRNHGSSIQKLQIEQVDADGAPGSSSLTECAVADIVFVACLKSRRHTFDGKPLIAAEGLLQHVFIKLCVLRLLVQAAADSIDPSSLPEVSKLCAKIRLLVEEVSERLEWAVAHPEHEDEDMQEDNVERIKTLHELRQHAEQRQRCARSSPGGVDARRLRV